MERGFDRFRPESSNANRCVKMNLVRARLASLLMTASVKLEQEQHYMNVSPKVTVRSLELPDDLEAVRKLWMDYLSWGNNKMQELYGVHPHHPAETVEQDIRQISKFQPLHGQLLLAVYEGRVCGLGSLKSISADIGEIKRMFVDPNLRRMGAGRAILEGLLTAARKIGYKKVRLDSPGSWKRPMLCIEVLVSETLKPIRKWKFRKPLEPICCLWSWT